MINKIGLSTALIALLAVSANAKTYTQEDMDKVLNRLDRLEKALGIQQKQIEEQKEVITIQQKDTDAKIKDIQATNEEEIEALHERADENEFQATMNKIKWGAELELTNSFIDGKTGSVPAMAAAGEKYSNNNQWTTRLRLSMDANIADNLKFTGRLSMYKNWSDSSNQGLTDPAQGRKPDGDSGLYVERAYVDYSPNDIFTVTLGRQPSSDGPGMTLIENTKRKSTYPSLLFDGAADGAVVSAKLASNSSMKPVVRAAYGKGFQKEDNYSPYTATTTQVDDLNVYGAFYEMSLPFESMGDNLIVLSYVMGTDFVGHPLQQNNTSNNPNLGDMELMGAYFENNKAFGSNFNYFMSAGWSMPDSNGKTATIDPGTGPMAMGLINEDGYAYHLGARYDFDIGVKIGYEFNHGSEHWFSFTNGSSDLLNKLSTRGDVHDIYGIYQIDMYQFVKLGYTDINYDFTGSGWHIGTPMKTNDYIRRAYGAYNLRF